MALYDAQDVFLKYLTPFLRIFKKQISEARGILSGTTRPPEIQAGMMWNNTDDGLTYYFDGTDDIICAYARPDDAEDGDKWVNLKGNPFGIYVVQGDYDLLTAPNLGEQTVIYGSNPENKIVNNGERIKLYGGQGTSNPTFSSLNHYGDGTAFQIFIRDKDDNVVSDLMMTNDDHLTFNGKEVVREMYDSADMSFYTTDDAVAKQYISLDSDLGGTPNIYQFLCSFARQGNTVTVNGKIKLDGVSYDSESTSVIVNVLDVMKLAKDQGYFDANVDVTGYASATTAAFVSSSDVTNWYGAAITAIYSSDDSSSGNQLKLIEQSSPWNGKNETYTIRQYYFNVSFSVKDV